MKRLLTNSALLATILVVGIAVSNISIKNSWRDLEESVRTLQDENRTDFEDYSRFLAENKIVIPKTKRILAYQEGLRAGKKWRAEILLNMLGREKPIAVEEETSDNLQDLIDNIVSHYKNQEEETKRLLRRMRDIKKSWLGKLFLKEHQVPYGGLTYTSKGQD